MPRIAELVAVIATVLTASSVDAQDSVTCNATTQFECRSFGPPDCIPIGYFCDGYADCAGAEDESVNRSCVSAPPRQCPRGSYKCADSDGRCIRNEFACDGISDCHDGSDEFNCTAYTCPTGWFACGVGRCIDPRLVCDGRSDCRDGSDESNRTCNSSVCVTSSQLFCPSNNATQRCVDMTSFCSVDGTPCNSSTYSKADCNVNECSSVNPPCSHTCVDLLVGYLCQCRNGYRLGSDRRTCTAINECAENPSICPQLCSQTAGQPYVCSCTDNYVTEQGGRRCTRQSQFPEPYLLLANRYYIRRLNIDGSHYTQISGLLTFAHVLDVDYETNTIYYVDIALATLNKMRMDGSGRRMVDGYQVWIDVNGIAVDWIGRKLYWTSENIDGVYVSEINGTMSKALVVGESVHARGIAVHPDIGYLFWTDWSYGAFIARIGMNGEQLTKIITTDIYWPNGITVDFQSNRIFWVDAGTVRIECAEFDGSNRFQIPAALSHPYAIAVFEDYIYWTDWNYKTVSRANKFGGNQTILVNNMPIEPYDIKVVEPLRHPAGVNPCGTNNGNCSHLCLIAPGGRSFTCACPQSLSLLPDGKTCGNCSTSQFTCTDGDLRCIPWYYVCDAYYDCLGGEDEPKTCPLRVCPSNQFQCATLSSRQSNCISYSQICDGHPHCADGSDENATYCQNRVCLEWEWKCPVSGKCIEYWRECDGTPDCPNGQDEMSNDTKCQEKVVCQPDEFQCNNSKCIPDRWYCDFDNDCGDRSDEPSTCWQYRADNPCQVGYKRCPKNYRCIPTNSFCDGSNDCRDQTDELEQYCSCKPGQFKCDNSHCIPERWLCDCYDDCGDGSDENQAYCTANNLYRECTDAEFRCDFCHCRSIALRCNGNFDCSDRTDEINCTCPSNTFQCAADKRCIDDDMRCNGRANCRADSSDEDNCPSVQCRADEFMCNNTMCIRSTFVCDGVSDCADGSDEGPTACRPCASGQFQCPVVRRCISATQVCDGIRDCEFGADELPPTCNRSCGAEYQFHCGNDRCVNRTLVCDRKDDCGDLSDEQQCAISDCSSCQQVCLNTSSGFVCSCNTGFRINSQNTATCIPVDYCQTLALNWCPQKCSTTDRPGYPFVCECQTGFTDLNADGLVCLPNNGLKGTVVYGVGRHLLGFNVTAERIIDVSDASTDHVVSVGIDPLPGHVYWLEATRMRRAAMPKDNTQQSPVQDMCVIVDDPTGIAVDWATKNIYWTESNGIYVTNAAVVCMKTTLLYDSNSTFIPTNIVVNPALGTMYFINSYRSMPTIMSASMSGENWRVLIGQELQEPTALAVDCNMQSGVPNTGGRLFWADLHKNVIESCAADGSDRTVVVSPANRPFMLDVFAGTIYWTTEANDRLVSVAQLGRGLNRTLLSEQAELGPIRILHSSRTGWPGANSHCVNRSCTLCLLTDDVNSAINGYKCVCPDMSHFIDDTRTKCSMRSNDPNYFPLPALKLCNLTGMAPVTTSSTMTTPSPTTTFVATPPADLSSTKPSETVTSSTTTTPLIASTSATVGTSSRSAVRPTEQSSTSSSKIFEPPTEVPRSGESSSGHNRTGLILAIVLPIGLGLLLIILIIVAVMRISHRGCFSESQQAFATLDEGDTDSIGPDRCRSVSVDSENINFNNPLFGSIVADRSTTVKLDSNRNTGPVSQSSVDVDDVFAQLPEVEEVPSPTNQTFSAA